MRRLTKFQPQVITDIFFKGYPHYLINSGMCFVWAYAAHLVYSNVKLCDVPCHAFVQYRGKFYDSDRPNGVFNWQELPASRFGLYSSYTSPSVKEFKASWNNETARFDTSWHLIEKKAMLVKSHGIQP